MKIKNKLIAGGLMSVVACALVGSITGTFAWYQYSNNATASFKGTSVKVSQNLQLKSSQEGADWVDGNLTWQAISGSATPVSLKPATTLNTLGVNWYGNPDGSSDELPEITDTAKLPQYRYTTSIFARIVEKENNATTGTPVAGKIYISDIAGLADAKIANAFTMLVEIGSFKYLFNPTIAAGDTVSLVATYTHTPTYDFSPEVGGAQQTVTINKGTLTRQAHSAIIGRGTDDAKCVTCPTSGVEVKITFWLEGFAQFNNSVWWTDQQMSVDFNGGFELTGFAA